MEFKFLLLIHLIGASVWTGGHLILSLTILPKALKNKELKPIQDFESSFERVGLPALLLQVITGIRMAYIYQPNIAEWFQFSSHLNTQIGIKVILLITTIALAIHARLFIIPRLTKASLPQLAYHIIGVTVLSLCFVFIGLNVRLFFI